MSCAAATGNDADDEGMEEEDKGSAEGDDAIRAGAANPSDWWLGIMMSPIRGAATELNEFDDVAPASAALPECRLSLPLALMLVPAPGPPRLAEEEEDDEAAMAGAECEAPRASSSCS